jgi:hypothetical protein
LGLPREWSQVISWLFSYKETDTPTPKETQTSRKFTKKFPEIPTLSTYGACATKAFWEKFLSNSIPATPETRIDISALKTIYEERRTFLLKSEQKRAEKCIDYLVKGGPAFQITPLGSCHVKNSKAALQHGEEVTDTMLPG